MNYWIAIESLANISKKDAESKFHFIIGDGVYYSLKEHGHF
ncbi:hypothetical protein [Abyssicoccus albus]|nr:hypothetical protein [Abyssicoccus albus]